MKRARKPRRKPAPRPANVINLEKARDAIEWEKPERIAKRAFDRARFAVDVALSRQASAAKIAEARKLVGDAIYKMNKALRQYANMDWNPQVLADGLDGTKWANERIGELADMLTTLSKLQRSDRSPCSVIPFSRRVAP